MPGEKKPRGKGRRRCCLLRGQGAGQTPPLPGPQSSAARSACPAQREPRKPRAAAAGTRRAHGGGHEGRARARSPASRPGARTWARPFPFPPPPRLSINSAARAGPAGAREDSAGRRLKGQRRRYQRGPTSPASPPHLWVLQLRGFNVAFQAILEIEPSKQGYAGYQDHPHFAHSRIFSSGKCKRERI